MNISDNNKIQYHAIKIKKANKSEQDKAIRRKRPEEKTQEMDIDAETLLFECSETS